MLLSADTMNIFH